MRFFTALTTFGLLAFAAAQNATTTVSESSSVSNASVATSTPSLTPQEKCLQTCAAADICCQAQCVGVPCPSPAQVNATTDCAAKCPQGNGTAGETEKYASCQASCISSNFFTFSSTPAPTASSTGSSSAAATFGAPDASTTRGSATTSGGSSRSGSASGSASATGSSGNGASAPEHVGVVGLGFLALAMAGMAL